MPSAPVARASGLLSPEQAARLVGKKRRTIRAWIAKGLPHTTEGRFCLIDPEVVREWADKHEQGRWKRFSEARIAKRTSTAPGQIYFLFDPKDGKPCYIGQTTTGQKRLDGHLRALRRGDHHNQHLQRLFIARVRDGYGEVTARIIEECMAFALDEREKWWIREGKAKGWNLCNATTGGEHTEHNEDTRRQLSEITKAKYQDPEYVRRWEESHAKRWGLTVEEVRQRREEKRQQALIPKTPRQPGKEATERKQRAELAELMKTLTPLTCGSRAFLPVGNGIWAVVDKGEWERLAGYRWQGHRRHGRKRGHRVKAARGGKTILLRRFIVGARDADVVQHRNGNDLDFQRKNLCVSVSAYGVCT